MAISHSHLLTAERMLTSYHGATPFPAFSRAWFREHRQHGSRDRRSILELCYAYFRLGASLTDATVKEQATVGLFLLSDFPNRTLEELEPGWNGRLPLSLEEKSSSVAEWYPGFEPSRIFPWTDELSPMLDATDFVKSHLRQPALYARVRPEREGAVLGRLAKESIPHERIGDHALRFPNGFDLAPFFTADMDVVVQDLSSQRVMELLPDGAGAGLRIWDCCAGSGGKSILLHDSFPDSRLSVSDIRPGILQNLKERFSLAGVKAEDLFVADLERNAAPVRSAYDLILADVPCSGSGTWGRNPESLRHFDPKSIAGFQRRQLSIAQNATVALRPGGQFIYVTCSVFKKENEDVVAELQRSTGLVLQEMKLLTGYQDRANTLFAARFILPA